MHRALYDYQLYLVVYLHVVDLELCLAADPPSPPEPDGAEGARLGRPAGQGHRGIDVGVHVPPSPSACEASLGGKGRGSVMKFIHRQQSPYQSEVYI